MATGSSIIGTWNVFVDWENGEGPLAAGTMTFAADYTWTYANGGGTWFQNEGMCLLGFSNVPGLTYTANVTKDAIVGITGYLGYQNVVGSWWGTRLGAAHPMADASPTAPVEAEAKHDIFLGPQKK
jgi:hypothetical protein